jgi:hypothetical protein
LLGCVPEFQVKYSIQFWANTIGMVWFGGCNIGLHLSVWFVMDIASLSMISGLERVWVAWLKFTQSCIVSLFMFCTYC